MRKSWTILAAIAALAVATLSARAETTLRAVMHSDLKIVDPIWTTAYISRNHGYMIYDTLFAMDAQGEIKPQMVDKYEVSADKLLYTLTLRDGLFWHDGKPVTAEDCIASIKRWAARDTLGGFAILAECRAGCLEPPSYVSSFLDRRFLPRGFPATS